MGEYWELEGGVEEPKFERRLVSQLLSHLANQLVSQPVNRLVCELIFLVS